MEIAILVLLVVVLGVVATLYLKDRTPPADPAVQLLQQQMEGLRQQLAASLASNADLLRTSSGDINQRLDNAAKLYADLRNQLGQLSEANAQIQSMVKDVSTLQDILRPPKLRGGMGEVLLENLLREILPVEHYAVQHRFQDGQIVDAVIRLKEGIVPVDAKFPLENFRRMLESSTDDGRKATRREFARNVKKHIDDIHTKYIRPQEGTFPFALMYIPAENVYYETIIKADGDDSEKALYAYATSRQVMPVSPNSFYAYLLTLAQGFRGMRVEEKAKEILAHLHKLRQELDRFTDDFRMVGRHLSNAQTKFEDSDKRLTRFQEKLLAAGEGAEVPAREAPKPLPSEKL